MNELVLKKNINDVIVQISLKEIKNEKEYEITGQWLKRVKETEKMVDGYFEPIKKEKYAEYKAVLNKIKKYKEPLTKVERVVKNMRIEYKRKVEEELLKQRQKLMEMVDTQEEKKEIAKVVDTEVKETDGIYHYTVYDFEVEDFNKIPREYLKVDEKKIRSKVKAMGKSANIPGIKVIEKIIEGVRT